MIVINDALNGIFDIFGKDENNEICAKLNVTKALAAQQQSLTRRVRKSPFCINLHQIAHIE